MNPYDYDLSNFQNTSGGVLPAEHLLILSAEGEDTKNIVLSDQRNFEARTELAYKVSENVILFLVLFYLFHFTCKTIHFLIKKKRKKDMLIIMNNFINILQALRINNRLTALAVEKGMIPEKTKKTWYEKEIAPIFHKKIESESSSSDDEKHGKSSKNSPAQKLKKMKKLEEKKNLDKNYDKNDKENKANKKMLHAVSKQLRADIKQEEMEKKEKMDAKIYHKIMNPVTIDD